MNVSDDDQETWTCQVNSDDSGHYKSTLALPPSQAQDQSDSSDYVVERRRTPLPKFQLFLVMLIQVAEPITGLVIYPFINQFIRDTGITRGDNRKIGYYAGIIVSSNNFYIRTTHSCVCLLHLARRNRYSSSLKQLLFSNGAGYPIVLADDPCYYSDLLAWYSQC